MYFREDMDLDNPYFFYIFDRQLILRNIKYEFKLIKVQPLWYDFECRKVRFPHNQSLGSAPDFYSSPWPMNTNWSFILDNYQPYSPSTDRMPRESQDQEHKEEEEEENEVEDDDEEEEEKDERMMKRTREKKRKMKRSMTRRKMIGSMRIRKRKTYCCYLI
ncbi:hypothetical protein ACOSQ2_010471 [Xanthoceras sorbifolium]